MNDLTERYWSCEHAVADRKPTPFGVECGQCGYLFSASNPIPPYRPAMNDLTPKVEQRHRDAAALFGQGHGYVNGYDYSASYMIQNGHWDNKPIVQAFARFEADLQSELTAARDALRRIAWLRPAGDCKNKLIIEMEQIALHALETTGNNSRTPLDDTTTRL